MAEQFFGATDTGRVRDNNEDSFLVQSVWDGGTIAACVIDGVGGYEGGEVAAELARSTIIEMVEKRRGEPIALMREGFVQAHNAIVDERQVRNPQMACVLTMVLADVQANQFHYAHVGDTRLYLLRDDSLVKISHDQSFVGFLEDSGKLAETAAMQHPKRNEIHKALGFGDRHQLPEDYIETGSSPFLPGDVLLLCSDGLTDLVPAADIKNILLQPSSLAQKVQQLIATANNAGGKDNITVVLVHNSKKPLKQKAKMPLVKKQNTTAQTTQTDAPAETAPAPPQKPPRAKPLSKERRNQTAVIALSFLCLVLMGGLAYLIWKQYKGTAEYLASTPAEKNVQERNLQQAINTVASDTLRLDPAVFGTTIKLTDTIFINRDSLYITGGNTLLRDSSFIGGGPAFVITPNCRWIVIDGLQFENFSTAILAANSNALELKSTSFTNCATTLAFAGNGQDFIHGMFINTRKPTNSSPQPQRR